MEGFEDYVVVEGDTIISIAEEYGIKVIDLINLNNLQNVYYLTPGDVLKVPVKHANFEFYTVKKGDNLYNIAKLYNIDVHDLEKINGLEEEEYIFPDQKLVVPKPGIKVYITKEGDTLESIADKIGINEEDLLLINDNIYLLTGQLIAYKLRT